jgi:serine O-acetyltransferase
VIHCHCELLIGLLHTALLCCCAANREEPALRRYYRNTILQYDTLDCALVHHLSNKLANDSVSAGEWFKLLEGVLREPCGRKLSELMRTDLLAIMARDPACEGPAHALLNYKGYLGLQASRIAHELWLRKRRSLALAIQSRVSEIFGMDVHPACRIGRGVMIDHATGVVFGETAVIGDECTILHGE